VKRKLQKIRREVKKKREKDLAKPGAKSQISVQGLYNVAQQFSPKRLTLLRVQPGLTSRELLVYNYRRKIRAIQKTGSFQEEPVDVDYQAKQRIQTGILEVLIHLKKEERGKLKRELPHYIRITKFKSIVPGMKAWRFEWSSTYRARAVGQLTNQLLQLL